MDDLFSEFLTLDPIEFVERTLTIEGQNFLLSGCGREYLHEPYRYICLEAVTRKGKPVVVKKGRQVEMTTTASAVSLYMACSGTYDHVRGLHVFPQIEQARRYSKLTFDPRLQESKGRRLTRLMTNSGSVTQKEFKDGNLIAIEGAGEEGDRLRGISLDYVLFDEIQDLPRTARENTLEAMAHSKFGPEGFGVELCFGTPKDIGSDFHELWNLSDRRFYYCKCIHCGHYFDLWYKYNNNKAVEGTNLSHGFMVKCEDSEGKGCKKLMHKHKAVKDGKWIPTVEDAEYRGYHIDQLLVPHIPREAIDKKLQERSIRNFQNEVMGDFYYGADTSLTFPEVVEKTTTDPDTRTWTLSTQVSDRQTWAGIDWGQRISGEDDEGTGGYTVFTVISRLPGNKLKLEFAKRLEQKQVVGPGGQIEEIKRWIRLYNCKYVACDHGAGHVQNQLLTEAYPNKVHRVFSTAGTKIPYKFDRKQKLITIDKHKAFEEVYDHIRNDFMFSFPYGNPEEVEWLMEHLANVEIVTKQLTNGTTRKIYQKQGPTRPIDGAAALVYAYIAYKFQQTTGFSNMHNQFGQNRNMPIAMGTSIRPTMRAAMAKSGNRRW